METKLLYLDDHYRKEADGKAVWHEFTDLVVDQTIFYPTSDGQPNDRGKVIIDGKEYVIVDTWLDGDNVHLMSHDTFPDDINGKPVHQILDWDIRYMHMRFRSALKIILALAYRDLGATMRINQTYDDQAWFDLEYKEVSEDLIRKLIESANDLIKKDIPIELSYVDKETFMRDQDKMKMCKGRVPDFAKIRIMHIDGLPDQMEFGTEVAKTSEIGTIDYKTSMVKGKVSNRVTITLR
ncbi:MAG: alanyl-tRNA editing protein [Thermoplasmataceae archaeon]